MNNLVRLDAESSARLRMVRPGDRTSFIPSAREAGELRRIPTLLLCGLKPSVPSRPLTSMSTGHRFTPPFRRGGGGERISWRADR